MTNQQLARWCSLGRGEVCTYGVVSTAYSYAPLAADAPVKDGIKIRPWGSNVWIDPEDDKPQFEGHTI